MKSIGYPNIFNTVSSANIIEDKEATLSNLKLLLTSEKGTLFGDPYFGVRLKQYLFEQNNKVLKDIIIDEIYAQIRTFMPQIYVERKDIDIVQLDNDNKTAKRPTLVANINLTNRVDYSRDYYSLVIFQSEE